MPIAQKKVIEILMEEVQRLEPRCTGYPELLSETINDIMEAERQHRFQGMRIQQLVTEKCKAAGDDLNRRRGHT